MALPLSPGSELGRYEIRSLLGAGGMGEVYLAFDTKLDRLVALKVLPAEAASNQERMRRFVQEAKAAAALNHPNIAHIYEIEEAAGLNFIVMEYVAGNTLGENIRAESPDLRKLLRYLQQVAEGLITAHSAGIVHRDLKPDNVMITRDGYAKILDFGLAKLVEPERTEEGSDDQLGEAITRDLRQYSRPGAVMGTVGYMSPEQARGQSVDQRSDIFSFGCILYESTTGHQPFAGDSAIDSLHKIIYEEPPPIRDFNVAAPPELQRIVRRCLRKDTEKRYQTIRDVANDLEDLRRELESETEQQHRIRPSQNHTTIVSTERLVDTEMTPEPAMRTAETNAARTVSSAQYILGEIKQHKRVTAIALIALMAVLVASGYGLFKLINKRNAVAPFHQMKMTRLTSTGKTASAAISPDGKYVVYVLADAGKQGLWLKHVATMSDVQIIPPAGVGYVGATFSPDGNFIYFIESEPTSELGIISRVPLVGGASRMVIERVDTESAGITFSPDGKRLAFARLATLTVVNADGSGEKELIKHDGSSWFGTLAWSPDGKVIAACVGNYTKEAFYMNVVGVSVTGGTEHAISSQWSRILGIASLGDGSGLMMSAKDQRSNPYQIWQLSYPTGEVHRVTNDLNDYFGVSLTADFKALVTVQSQTISNIWVVPNGDESLAKQIITGGKYPTWTPDDRIAYTSRPTGKHDIWLAEADGTGQKQLSFDANDNSRPMVTPDNRYLVFAFFRDGRPYIGRMDSNGSNLKALTSDLGASLPFHISPDSQWVVYVDFKNKGLWKVSIEGGDPVPLTEGYQSYSPAVSPDGKLIACYFRDWGQGAFKIAVFPFNGGQPLKTFEAPLAQEPASPLRWTVDGQAVVYINTLGDLSNLWSQALDGSPPKQLTHFTSDQISWFDWSRDGKQLVLARGTTTRDAILISNLDNSEFKQPGN